MAGGAGQFEKVTLRPHIVVAAGSDLQKAHDLHKKAHEMCFIARSVSFPVRTEPAPAVLEAAGTGADVTR